MKMRTIRAGVFSRRTAAVEGGADTLVRTLAEKVSSLGIGENIQIVSIPWEAWSQRRNPLRFMWVRFARTLGLDVPEVDLRPVCRQHRIDIAYFTVPAFVRIDIPFVFTLWDIGHRTIPEFQEMRTGRVPWNAREALCRRMLAQASFVVVGNRVGAIEAQNFFGLNPERVIPIPFPNPDFSEVTAVPFAGLSAQPFFLYPAQFWPHKNHFTLLRALAILVSRVRTVPKLIFVGSEQGNGPYLKSAAAELGVAEHVHFAGFVSRGELRNLYERAAGLTFPSLLGPNNLPPQEAAILGCPIILSNLPGHQEQMGDGALYVSPLDAEGWANAMSRLMSEPSLRSTLVTRAKNAVASYTIDGYASALGDVLRRVAAYRMLWGE